jgi:hypothetical protein
VIQHDKKDPAPLTAGCTRIYEVKPLEMGIKDDKQYILWKIIPVRHLYGMIEGEYEKKELARVLLL